MKTELGIFLAKLRIAKQELLKDMAEKLGVTSAFLSAVENGKKKIPESWKSIIVEMYSLNEDEKRVFENAIWDTKSSIDVNIQGKTDSQKKLAITFARTFETLDKKTEVDIMNLLAKFNEREGG